MNSLSDIKLKFRLNIHDLKTRSEDNNINNNLMPKKNISEIRQKNHLLYLFKVIIQKINTNGEKAGPFKVKQYVDGIRILESYNEVHLSDYEDICKHFEKNGKKRTAKLLQKINEFLETGSIEEADHALQNPKVMAVMELTKIYGIGPKKAIDLYDKYQIQNIHKLRQVYSQDKTIINSKQVMGMDHYEDLESRIPRKEMDDYYQFLLKICKDVSPNIVMSINGSYRRGAKDSGDIDVLITTNSDSISSGELRQKLIKHLIKIGLITHTLANGKHKFMGISKLEGFGLSRHMDIMDTAPENYPFAVLYFTGSGAFNARMRAHALKQGYSLNEYELSDKLTKIGVKSNTIVEKIGKDKFESEIDIFKFLKFDYKTPQERELITYNKI